MARGADRNRSGVFAGFTAGKRRNSTRPSRIIVSRSAGGGVGTTAGSGTARCRLVTVAGSGEPDLDVAAPADRHLAVPLQERGQLLRARLALGGVDDARRHPDGDAGEDAHDGHHHQHLDEREALCRSRTGERAGSASAGFHAGLVEQAAFPDGGGRQGRVAHRVVPRVRSCHRRTPTENVATITNRAGDDPARCVRQPVQVRADARRPAPAWPMAER